MIPDQHRSDARAAEASARRESIRVRSRRWRPSHVPLFDMADIIEALRRAVAATPDDLTLRLHLADQLVAAGRQPEAIVELAAVLAADPGNAAAKAAMQKALSVTSDTPSGPEPEPAAPRPAVPDSFDWDAAEQQVDSAADPWLQLDANAALPEPAALPISSKFRVEPPDVTLADVGGMQAVKERLIASFLAPLRNPELRKRFAKSMRGGLLLYGPPGCGKTMIARAMAGELGAKFLSVGITDVYDAMFGATEQNLHEAFQVARREAPCVLFFDEIDALGARRSQMTSSWTRTSINQLLVELDGIDAMNEGVFVLAATNQPWDVDPALRRPGRLDRTVLVLPPDLEARRAIFQHHLKGRPVEKIDTLALAKKSEGMSGADIYLVCETATEEALLAGARTGDVRDITQKDFERALSQTRPSIGPWLDSARNVVLFGDDDGTYADLRAYLKKAKRL